VHSRLIKGLLYAASGFVVLVVLGWGYLAAAEATASPSMVLNPSVPLVENGVRKCGQTRVRLFLPHASRPPIPIPVPDTGKAVCEIMSIILLSPLPPRPRGGVRGDASG
jgi:hypothetical protein